MSSRRCSSPPTHSIVEYFYPPESSGHRCGYCKSPNTNFSHGMWAHTLSVDNYESLINTGWRRSGSYLYKPMNEKVCCPMYTIRNLSTTVEISRGQRKVLKRFKKYVADGVQKKPEQQHESRNNGTPKESITEGERMQEEIQVPDQKIRPAKKLECQTKEIHADAAAKKHAQRPERGTIRDPPTGGSTSGDASGSGKPHPLKKKHLRREKKRQKLIARGEDPDEFFRRNERNRVAELESFFKPEPGDSVSFHTKLVKVDSEEFEDTFKLEHALYQKYQMHTHGDSLSECRASQFRRFLCDNPFKHQGSRIGTVTPEGTYHQQYYMNGHLMAVGVLDILPHCVSSVYFFYDPEYSFLSPGTLGALYEISFVNELHRSNALMRYYYLGFYIHTCQKMKYKRKFQPCELVCPFTLEWVRFDGRVLNILDEKKYAPFTVNQTSQPRPDEDVRNVLLLHNRSVRMYDSYGNRVSEKQELQSYVNLVTGPVASNMLLYRSTLHDDDD